MGSFNTKKVTKTKAVRSSDDEFGDVINESFNTGSVASIQKRQNSQRPWSKQQQAIFDACEKDNSSLIIEALAGTGKTTTAIEMLNHLSGKILYCAFNKRIADELKTRIASSGASDQVHCSTLHGLGLRLIQRLQPGTGVDNLRGLGIAQEALRAVGGPLAKSYQWMVKNTASICKEVAPFIKASDGKVVAEIGYSFGHLDRLDPRFLDVTCDAVLEAMRRSLEFTGSVDYSDMLYIPLHKPATSGEYDVVIVDEAQDMNRAQLALAQRVLKENGRLIVVGDRHQAIYWFRGADKGSMDRLAEAFKAKVLPLSVTYRCPLSVVQVAGAFVPALEAAPSAPKGSVLYKEYDYLREKAAPGNFILSRLNGPLLRLCLDFIKAGKPAIVEGRDVGAGLINLINKLTYGNPNYNLRQFLQELRVHVIKTAQELEAKDDLERAKQIQDQGEAMAILAEGCNDIAQLKLHIDRMFEDTNGKSNKIILSTVHKAKGLESDTVFILCDTFNGSWEEGQGEEANLKYVAITRSKNTLVFIAHPTGPSGE
jgi:DNA helicase-2/ATP-dependent DNA helicase PcrA